MTRRRHHSALARSRLQPDAFTEVYDEFAARLLRFFATRVDDQQTALDLTAETLATVYELRQDFRGSSDEETRAWIWRIARTTNARYWRRRSVDRSAMQRIGLPRPVATDHELERIEELAAVENTRDAVSIALAELPVDQQTVIRMRYVDELTDQVIAERLAVSPQVVRARASRGMRRLRQDLRLRSSRRLEDPPA